MTAGNAATMRQAFFRLHLSIFLAGFTGVLGKVITISEGMLVWYRQALTLALLWGILWVCGKLHRLPRRDILRIGGAGVLLCLHWLFFYGSIKASNVSIGVVCFALVGLFTALLEPLFAHRRLSAREVGFSLLTLLGIGLIFSFDTRYRWGIGLGVVSSLMAALFTIANKHVSSTHAAGMVLLYEMAGGLLFLSCLLPAYIHWWDITYLAPTPHDAIGLLLLSLFCTVGMFMLLIQALRHISAFTVNLSYNLEPVYSIVIAILFLDEGRELNAAFYAGLSVIVLSVALQSYVVWRQQRSLPR